MDPMTLFLLFIISFFGCFLNICKSQKKKNLILIPFFLCIVYCGYLNIKNEIDHYFRKRLQEKMNFRHHEFVLNINKLINNKKIKLAKSILNEYVETFPDSKPDFNKLSNLIYKIPDKVIQKDKIGIK